MNKSTNTNRHNNLKSLFLIILAFVIMYKLPLIFVQMKSLAEGIMLWGGSIGLVLAFLFLVNDTSTEPNHN